MLHGIYQPTYIFKIEISYLNGHTQEKKNDRKMKQQQQQEDHLHANT